MKSALGLAFLLVIGPGLVCANEPTDKDISELTHMLQTDPHKAVVDAIAARDLRFLALNRDRPEVPGVPDYSQRYVEIYGTRILPGTTGRPRDVKQAELVRKVRGYAERYNRLLLEWLRQADAEQARASRAVTARFDHVRRTWRIPERHSGGLNLPRLTPI
jgi:hypothetical protein